MSDMTLFATYTIQNLCGAAIVSYRTMATQRGWSMGEMYADPSGTSAIQLLGLAAILHSLVGSLLQIGWAYALGVLAIGWVFASLVVIVLGPRVQVLCPIGVIACLLVIALG